MSTPLYSCRMIIINPEFCLFISDLGIVCVLYRNIYRFIFFTCFTAIDERSGSGSWGSAEQDSPSFSQGRVRFTYTHNLKIQTSCAVFIHLNIVHVNNGVIHVFCLKILALTPSALIS